MLSKCKLSGLFIIIGTALLMTPIDINAQWMPYTGFNYYPSYNSYYPSYNFNNLYGGYGSYGNFGGYSGYNWNQPSYNYPWNQPSYGYGWNQPSYGWNTPYNYGWNQPTYSNVQLLYDPLNRPFPTIGWFEPWAGYPYPCIVGGPFNNVPDWLVQLHYAINGPPSNIPGYGG